MAWWSAPHKDWYSEDSWPTSRRGWQSDTSWPVEYPETTALDSDIRWLLKKTRALSDAHAQLRAELAQARSSVREANEIAEQALAKVRNLQETVSVLKTELPNTVLPPPPTELPPTPLLPQQWRRQCFCCRVKNAQLLKEAPPDVAGGNISFTWVHRAGPLQDVYGYARQGHFRSI